MVAKRIIKTLDDVTFNHYELGLHEYELVIRRLYRMQKDLPSALTAIGDEETVRANLARMSQDGKVLKVYSKDYKYFYGIVIFDIGLHWYSPKLVLFEQEILCVNKDVVGFGRVAIALLEKMAKRYRCSAVVAGNTGNDPAVDNLYRKRGYKLTYTYVKGRDKHIGF